MLWKERRLRVGDWVEVRSREEILRTLDSNAECDGMPFMPEMFAFCGKRFKVHKRAHKTCDTVFPIRGRRVKRAVHLETRCDGGAHGGCEARCLIFWKEVWLKPIRAGSSKIEQGSRLPDRWVNSFEGGIQESEVWARTRHSGRDGEAPVFVCQATQLPHATKSLAWWDVRQYLEDYCSGNVGFRPIINGLVFSMYSSLVEAGFGLGPSMRWIYNRARGLWRGPMYPGMGGTIREGQPTPTVSLNLQPGELVRVKSHEEILSTISTRNQNRGMSWDAEMVPYCGGIYRVLARVTRIINEKTGAMQEMKNPCIVLDSVVCEGRYSKRRKFCPRGIYPYWRETWLERVAPAPHLATGAASGVDGSGMAGGRWLCLESLHTPCERQKELNETDGSAGPDSVQSGAR